MPASLGFGLSWKFKRDPFPDAPPPSESRLLLENNTDVLLLESGDRLLLEG